MTDRAANNHKREWWRSIKSAPKNTYVLVGTTEINGNDGCRVVVSKQYKSQRKLSTGKFWGWDHTGAKWTHWMPFPEPPNVS